MKEKLKVFSNGLLKENPSLRLVLGTCPTLAVTTLAVNGLGMGLAATFVLVCSNIAISALKKIIASLTAITPRLLPLYPRICRRIRWPRGSPRSRCCAPCGCLS